MWPWYISIIPFTDHKNISTSMKSASLPLKVTLTFKTVGIWIRNAVTVEASSTTDELPMLIGIDRKVKP